MASSRDKWLIGAVGLTAIAVAGTVYSLVAEKQRDVTVSKLRAKTEAAIGMYSSPTGKAAPVQASVDAVEAGPSQTEQIARLEKVFRKRRVMETDPSHEEAERILGMRPEERTEADLEKLKEYLSGCSDLIRELRELAGSGGPVYELDFSKGYAMELPHLSQLRDCARLLAADAAVQAAAGRYDEAAQDLLAAMKLADALDSEPILISQLVRMAMDNIVYSTVSASMPGGDLPPEAARALIEYAAGAGHREAFANSFNGEGLFGLSAFEDIRSSNANPLLTMGHSSSSEPLGGFLLRVYGSPIARPWLNMDEAAFADIIGQMGEAAALPYYESKPVFDQIAADVEGLPRTRVLSRTLLPALTRAIEAQARHEAFLGLMSLGLSVEQYYAQTGQYPPTLSDVAAMVGGSIPMDPFTGQPFGYETSGGSYTLYSRMGSVIELNDHRRQSLPVDAQGNLVWRRVRPGA